MHVQEFSLNQASLLSDGFFSVDPSENGPPRILPTYPTHRSESSSVLTTLQRILNRLGKMELPGADQLEAFLRHICTFSSSAGMGEFPSSRRRRSLLRSPLNILPISWIVPGISPSTSAAS